MDMLLWLKRAPTPPFWQVYKVLRPWALFRKTTVQIIIVDASFVIQGRILSARGLKHDKKQIEDDKFDKLTIGHA